MMGARLLAGLAALLVLLPAFGGAPLAADASLSDLAKTLVSATADGDQGPIIARFEPVLAAAYHRAAKNTEEEIIDFDWSTNSQDPDLEAIQKTIDSHVDSRSDREAIISITFRQFDEDVLITYEVEKSNTQWLIHDVVYPGDGFSLRNLVLPE